MLRLKFQEERLTTAGRRNAPAANYLFTLLKSCSLSASNGTRPVWNAVSWFESVSHSVNPLSASLLWMSVVWFFHRSDSCGKKLDTSAVNEHDREAYCRACYGRYFGAKGYGFAGGAAGLVGDYDGKIDFSANDNDYEHNGYNGSGDYNGSWAYGGSGDYSGSGDYNGSGEGYECAYNYWTRNACSWICSSCLVMLNRSLILLRN